MQPNDSLLSTADGHKAASSVSCGTGANCDFTSENIGKAERSVAMKTIWSVITKRYGDEGQIKVSRYVKECRAQISRRLSFIRYNRIKNESILRYVYGDAVVQMLVAGHGHAMEIEGTIGDQEETVVSGDYRCWQLRLVRDSSEFKDCEVCVIVMETKRNLSQPATLNKCIGQLLGYYCANKRDKNTSGVALLLNSYEQTITIGIFIFPYFKDGFTAQSLMLPLIQLANEPCLTDGVLVLIYLLSISDDLLKLPCKGNVIFCNQIFVYSEQQLTNFAIQALRELVAQKDQQLAEKLAEKDRQLAEKDQQLAEKDQQITDLLTKKRRLA